MKKMIATLVLTIAPCLVFAGDGSVELAKPNGFESAAIKSAPAVVEKYKLGKQYQAITPPVRTNDPDKIEVVEAFSYVCIHCEHFEAKIEPWAAKLPADVDFQRAPVIFNEGAQVFARVYYSLKLLNVLPQMHPVVFKAVLDEKKDLKNEKQFAEFFAGFGIKERDFLQQYNSFTVQSLVQRDDANVRSYGITGTPEMVVDGKYRVSMQDAGGPQEVLNVVSFLIEKERQARMAKASSKK